MFDADELEQTVDLQRRAYRLLLWLERALERGEIAPEAPRTTSTPGVVHDWLREAQASLPEDACPPSADQFERFAHMFSTFIDNTFAFDDTPGWRRVTDHCWCFACSWMVRAPYLRPAKPDAAGKARAKRMMRAVVQGAGVACSPAPVRSDAVLDGILRDPALRQDAARCAYGEDLLARARGIAVGRASLVLWRAFAWTPTGSPKPGFRLETRDILDAEARLSAALRTATEK